MALNSINTNVAAYSAQANINRASDMAGSSISRLSSGNRLARASDDVAALSIGTALSTNVSTLRTASVNAAQGQSLLGVADGALKNIGDMLARQKALSVQANSGTVSDTERAYLDQEFQALTTELGRMVTNTTFNGITLLDGSISSSTGTVTTADPDAFADFAIQTNTTAGIFGASGLALVNEGGVDPKLVGAFSGNVTATATYTTGTNAIMTLTVNGQEYISAETDVSSNNAFSFISSDPDARMGFTLTLNAAYTPDDGTFDEQADADELAADALTALNNVVIKQTRELTNFTAPTSGDLKGFKAGDATITSADFNSTDGTIGTMSSFIATGNGATAGDIMVTLNGEVYESAAVTNGFGGDGLLDSGVTLTLTSVSDSNNVMSIALSNIDSSVSINMETTAGQKNFQNLLNDVFEVGSDNSGLDFQVGTATTDKITVTVGSATASTLGTSSLSVTTAANAATASTALDTAINTVTSIRADVGAQQSRFDFVAANLESSIQNVDAARGVFEDTDITEESTNFAQYQVQLQAGISVLAQANQLPQNLLQLLG